MSGVKGRSGRKKSPSTMVDEALETVDQALPDIFTGLIERAKGLKVAIDQGDVIFTREPDREAAIYLIDRVLGRPKQAIDQRMTLDVQISPDERMQKLLEVEAEARLLLAPWRAELDASVGKEDDVQEQREETGSVKAGDAEEAGGVNRG